MNCPKVALFDLDDTLAESFKPPTAEMMHRIKALLEHLPIAIVSGAKFERIKVEVLDRLASSPHLSNLFVFADNAAQGYRYAGEDWNMLYSHEFTPEEQAVIEQIIHQAVLESDVFGPNPPYQPQLLKDPAQLRYAALGLDASEDDKVHWDVDMQKRKKIKDSIAMLLPECEVSIGGRTTIDITRKGVNKAYGVNWIAKHLGIEAHEMLFVGDALYEGGNDAVVIPTGIETISVTGPDDTAKIIDELLMVCKP
ncbi:MAG TPA: HAD-IIB family hydrolase [Candidatus Paceibacterota bacterium]|nr:HAD-IIB family hydrolase [Candidatus Paceibacterota bacterium]